MHPACDLERSRSSLRGSTIQAGAECTTRHSAKADCVWVASWELLALPAARCGRQIAEAFVIATVIVLTDEGVDLCFKIAGQIVLLEQDPVLERLMPTLDLTLGHWVIRRASNMIHTALRQPVGQIVGEVA